MFKLLDCDFVINFIIDQLFCFQFESQTLSDYTVLFLVLMITKLKCLK